MRKFEARECQKPIINLMLNNKRANIFASPGTGKTSATLSALTMLDAIDGDVFPALVVAPLRVANVVWESEIQTWKQFSHLKVSKILGSAKERKQAIYKKADIYLINYENLEWLDKTLENWTFNTCVCDESTKIKSHRVSLNKKKDGTKFLRVGGAKNARALVKHLHNFKRWYNLTGTPTPNGIQDIWGQQFAIDGGKALGRNYTAFIDRFFRLSPGSDPRFKKYEPMPGSEDEITSLISNKSVVVDAYDYFDITKPLELDLHFSLDPNSKKIYEQMEKFAIAEIENGTLPIEVMAKNGGSKLMKCRQIASGYLRDEDGNWNNLHCEKIKVLKEIVDSINAPVLVAYYFQKDLEEIMKAFPKAVVMPTGKWQQKVVKDWNDGKIEMLLISPQSAGHGLSLQHGGNNLVIYTMDWNAEYYEQVIERLGPTRQAQSGYKRLVYVHRIIAKGTWDEDIADALKNKRKVSEAVKKAIDSKRKKGRA